MTTTFCYAQVAVRTEGPSGLKKHIHIAKTDTVTDAKFFVGLTVNTSVAADSIIIRSGTVADTVAIIVFGASPPAYPFYVQYGVKVDSLVTIKKKGSDITLIYRTGY